MTANDVIFTEEEREELCVNPQCEEHSGGKTPCSLPRDKDHAVEIAQREERDSSNTLSLREHAKTKTATAIVEYSDEE